LRVLFELQRRYGGLSDYYCLANTVHTIHHPSPRIEDNRKRLVGLVNQSVVLNDTQGSGNTVIMEIPMILPKFRNLCRIYVLKGKAFAEPNKPLYVPGVEA
jgi:hypothetical protein